MDSRSRLAVGLAAALLSGCLATAAVAEPKNPGKTATSHQCFWTRDVNGFRAQDDRTVNVRVGVNDIFQLTLFSPAPDIDWTQRIGVQSSGGSSICSGLDASIIVPGPIGPQRYPVTSIRKLTAQQIADLPHKARP